MPQLIRPGDVQVVTQNGECLVNINLELTIKLDGSNLTIEGVSAQSAEKDKIEKEKEEKVEWQVPDFGSSQKLKFGKEE